MSDVSFAQQSERVFALARLRSSWSHARATCDYKRFWIPPLMFGLCATGFAYAHSVLAWGTYVRAHTLHLTAVPALFGPLYCEFAVVGAAACWTYRSRRARMATLGCLASVLLVNGLQLVSTTLSSEFLTGPVVRLAPLFRTVVSARSVTLASAGPAICLVVLWATFRFTRWERSQFGTRAFAAASALLGGILLLSAAFLPSIRDFRARYGLCPSAPVLSLCGAIANALFDSAGTVAPPSQDELRVALEAGMSVDPRAAAPLVKDWIYQSALPFPKRAGHAEHPNVIVFFFESWSAEVLGPYNPRWTRVTPNLDAFAEHAMRVDDYVNHAIPTVTGLRGQLCSMFPSLAYTPWHQPQKPVVGQVLCLPKVLSDAGYESVYLNHGPPAATHFDSQAIDWGFERSYFVGDIVRELLPGEKPAEKAADASDDQMLRATIALLDARRKHAQKRPLFLAVSTLQTHTGIDVPHKFGNGRNPVLNTFSNLDNAFGVFWKWYQRSAWADDTILILTGDHVLYPHEALRQVASKRYLNDRFGYLGLFILDPTHALPPSFAVRSSSIDFAPTLIQLLGLPSHQRNPFMGLSMFGDRQHTQLALGFNYGTDLLIWDRARAAPDIFHEPKSGRARQLFDVLRYEQQLERDHRIWFR